jgi:hypothetical protein
MENIEVHLDINAEVVIPEWLRAKMGLTKDIEDDDAEDEPCCCCDDEAEDDDAYSRVCPETAEEKARRKAVDDLVKALRNAIVGDDDLTVSLRDK